MPLLDSQCRIENLGRYKVHSIIMSSHYKLYRIYTQMAVVWVTGKVSEIPSRYLVSNLPIQRYS